MGKQLIVSRSGIMLPPSFVYRMFKGILFVLFSRLRSRRASVSFAKFDKTFVVKAKHRNDDCVVDE